MAWLMPGLMLAFVSFQPAALQLSFMTTSLCGVAQGRFFQIPSVRKALGLYPLFRPGQPQASSPTLKESAVRTQSATMSGYQAPKSQASSGMFGDVKKAWKQVKTGVRHQMGVGEAKQKREALEHKAKEYNRTHPPRDWR